MKEEKNELTVKKNDVLAVSFLKQNGNNVQGPFSREIFLMHTMINGTGYVDKIQNRAAKLREGERVQLILEPNNKHDSKAILVKTKRGGKLGYIPRNKNEVLFHLMDAGKYLFGVVTYVANDEGNLAVSPFVRIFIDVFMVD